MSSTHIGLTSRVLLCGTALGVALAVSFTAAGAQSGGRAVRIDATTARTATDWDRQIEGLKSAGALRLNSSKPDLLLAGRTHERFDQYVNGVRIYGAQTVRQSTDQGLPVSVFGTVHTQLSIDTTPSLTPAQAITRAAALTGGTPLASSSPELVVLPMDEGSYALAWLTHVSTRTNVFAVFVDAKTGAELRRVSAIRTDSRVGIGTGVLGDQKKISVDNRNGAFFADDRLRPPSIVTFDLKGDIERAIRILDRFVVPTQGDIAVDPDNTWTDVANVDGHAHLGYAYDYFFKRFNRRGLDNNDGPIYAMTHPMRRADIFNYNEEMWGLFLANAFWCGVCGPNGRGIMAFGDGLPVGVFTVEVNYFAGALDIVGHELTHGVVEYTSNLLPENEPGALNEAFADMMGASIEAFYQPAGSGVLKSDWLMGEDIVRPLVPGFVRSMADPQAFDTPDHYSRRRIGAADNGYVHDNSTIPSHAFYLAIEGGTNRTSGRSVTGVGTGNREQIERVFYRAFTQLLPPDATFAVARQATLQAAADLYGPTSPAFRSVSQAWDAVGVQ